jgi:hypothetical protein
MRRISFEVSRPSRKRKVAEGNPMRSEDGMQDGSNWKWFMRKHWGVVGIFVVACALAFAFSVYVFLWFVSNAESTGLVPTSLGLWTMANLVSFILNLILWELVLVGIPVAVGALVAWLWWRRLPLDERKDLHFGRGSRTTGGSGGVSLFFFIAFCIKVYLDGKWNVAIGTWTLDYVVNSMVLILEWVVVVFGIPIAIGLVWWIRHEMKKS